MLSGRGSAIWYDSEVEDVGLNDELMSMLGSLEGIDTPLQRSVDSFSSAVDVSTEASRLLEDLILKSRNEREETRRAAQERIEDIASRARGAPWKHTSQHQNLDKSLPVESSAAKKAPKSELIAARAEFAAAGDAVALAAQPSPPADAVQRSGNPSSKVRGKAHTFDHRPGKTISPLLPGRPRWSVGGTGGEPFVPPRRPSTTALGPKPPLPAAARGRPAVAPPRPPFNKPDDLLIPAASAPAAFAASLRSSVSQGFDGTAAPAVNLQLKPTIHFPATSPPRPRNPLDLPLKSEATDDNKEAAAENVHNQQLGVTCESFSIDQSTAGVVDPKQTFTTREAPILQSNRMGRPAESTPQPKKRSKAGDISTPSFPAPWSSDNGDNLTSSAGHKVSPQHTNGKSKFDSTSDKGSTRFGSPVQAPITPLAAETPSPSPSPETSATDLPQVQFNKSPARLEEGATHSNNRGAVLELAEENETRNMSSTPAIEGEVCEPSEYEELIYTGADTSSIPSHFDKVLSDSSKGTYAAAILTDTATVELLAAETREVAAMEAEAGLALARARQMLDRPALPASPDPAWYSRYKTAEESEILSNPATEVASTGEVASTESTATFKVAGLEVVAGLEAAALETAAAESGASREAQTKHLGEVPPESSSNRLGEHENDFAVNPRRLGPLPTPRSSFFAMAVSAAAEEDKAGMRSFEFRASAEDTRFPGGENNGEGGSLSGSFGALEAIAALDQLRKSVEGLPLTNSERTALRATASLLARRALGDLGMPLSPQRPHQPEIKTGSNVAAVAVEVATGAQTDSPIELPAHTSSSDAHQETHSSGGDVPLDRTHSPNIRAAGMDASSFESVGLCFFYSLFSLPPYCTHILSSPECQCWHNPTR